MIRLFAIILVFLTVPAMAGITLRETSVEPWRYAVTVTNDTADRTMWAVCVGGEEAVLGAENLPVNWRVDSLDDMTWRWIVVWSSVAGSDLLAGGVMTFDLTADQPLTMLGYTLQYSGGWNVEGAWAVPEPETGLLACAGIGALAYRRRKQEKRFEKGRRWSEAEMGELTAAAKRVREIRQRIDQLPCNPRGHAPERGLLHRVVAKEIARLAALTGRTKAAVRWMVCFSKAMR